MTNTTIKAHYLTEVMTGFENVMGTRITSVERYESQEPNTLYIYARVNPTTEMYISPADRVDAVVKYDLVKDTYTIKVEGKGSRKFGTKVKNHMTSVIDSLVQEAEQNRNTDEEEAKNLTKFMYYRKMKQNGATNAVCNEFDVKTMNSKSVAEILEVFEALNPVQEEVAEEVATPQTFVGQRVFSGIDWKYGIIVKEFIDELGRGTDVLIVWHDGDTSQIDAINLQVINEWTDVEKNGYYLDTQDWMSFDWDSIDISKYVGQEEEKAAVQFPVETTVFYDGCLINVTVGNEFRGSLVDTVSIKHRTDIPDGIYSLYRVGLGVVIRSSDEWYLVPATVPDPKEEPKEDPEEVTQVDGVEILSVKSWVPESESGFRSVQGVHADARGIRIRVIDLDGNTWDIEKWFSFNWYEFTKIEGGKLTKYGYNSKWINSKKFGNGLQEYLLKLAQ